MRRAVQMAEVFLVACLAPAPVRADFVNGDFEQCETPGAGPIPGWTKDGGQWYGGIGNYTPSGDPGKTAIVTQGPDPILASVGIGLPMVYDGRRAARVNNGDSFWTGWGDYHFSMISQETLCTHPKLILAWCAVLEEPHHEHEVEPHFYIKVEEVEDPNEPKALYVETIASDTAPEYFTAVDIPTTGTVWKYSGWRKKGIDVAELVGKKLRLTLLACDCGLGAHSGYVYLDAIKAVSVDSETANALKGSAMNRLSNCVPTPSKWLNGRLCEAIKQVRSSLETSRWRDGDHLHPKRGAGVFDHERRAAEVLVQVAANPSVEPVILADVEESLADLAAADDRLAKTIIDEATAVVTKPKALVMLQAARAAYNAANGSLAAGNYPVAISQYKKAWQHATNAMSSNR